ncbi:Stp1/IreP family PP2C-type Ser/Thr phosphatase [Virgibacillus litoralis]|uniref:Protein phosphatase n=1 Tax=Virgibacillus litoralis TaxID=578221 RepID=A0ABS4HIG7_9BACI|nr:Stp1/IreP family PP2C-type Ser/Thr phosphatase [Virgibacillus litoralis]MBP1950712.1 protein phosphatase [Virgibacillus litoralis]
MKGKFLTDKGQIRNHNEDSGGVFYNQSDQMLAIVADGMGGHQAGDVASQMATAVIQKKWQECKQLTTPEETEVWLSKSVQEINNSIFEQAKTNEECQGMGTTVVIAICTEDFATISHVGDSRGYILNETGFKQLTEDHSLVNELVRSGQISKDDAEQHPRKNVLLKALGTDINIKADTISIGWEHGDKLLLCSDGLTNKVTDEELFEFTQLEKGLEASGHEMIKLANERGGEDNISLVIVHHDSTEKEGES